jgi:AcrR family transcriptional regulator
MARPVGADPAATRERILHSAAKLFAERGVPGTTIRDVARDAGVSLGIVHHHFGSKAELHRRSLESLYGELSDELLPLAGLFDSLVAELAGALASEARDALIERVVRAGYRFARAHRAVIRTAMRPLVETGDLDPGWERQAHEPFVARSAARLASALGRTEADLRGVVQALLTLGMRGALASPAQLAREAGLVPAEARRVSAAIAQEAVSRAEDQLVRLALALLRPEVTSR